MLYRPRLFRTVDAGSAGPGLRSMRRDGDLVMLACQAATHQARASAFDVDVVPA